MNVYGGTKLEAAWGICSSSMLPTKADPPRRKTNFFFAETTLHRREG